MTSGPASYETHRIGKSTGPDRELGIANSRGEDARELEHSHSAWKTPGPKTSKSCTPDTMHKAIEWRNPPVNGGFAKANMRMVFVACFHRILSVDPFRSAQTFEVRPLLECQITSNDATLQASIV